MKHNTKRERQARFYQEMSDLGFSFVESDTLRRIEMTLQRWGEAECGDSNDYCSWGIERDETTGIPYRVTYPHNGKPSRHRIPDREKGALKRANAILAVRNARHFAPNTIANGIDQMPGYLLVYHQSDPRGCALYLVRKSDIPEGRTVDEFYTRGFAVCY